MKKPGGYGRYAGVHSTDNKCARAMIGIKLQQHRMRHFAVEDDDTFDPLFERIDAGLKRVQKWLGTEYTALDQWRTSMGGQL